MPDHVGHDGEQVGHDDIFAIFVYTVAVVESADNETRSKVSLPCLGSGSLQIREITITSHMRYKITISFFIVK